MGKCFSAATARLEDERALGEVGSGSARRTPAAHEHDIAAIEFLRQFRFTDRRPAHLNREYHCHRQPDNNEKQNTQKITLISHQIARSSTPSPHPISALESLCE
jgi:hypothetical protein